MPIVRPTGITPPLRSGPTRDGNNAGPTYPQSPAVNPAGGRNFPDSPNTNLGVPWDSQVKGNPALARTWDRTPGGIYLPARRVTFTLVPEQSIQILNVPEGVRVSLQVRSARASQAVVGIQFGFQVAPTDQATGEGGGLNTADFELAPGEAFSYDGQGWVPQDYVFARMAGLYVPEDTPLAYLVVTYAEWVPYLS